MIRYVRLVLALVAGLGFAASIPAAPRAQDAPPPAQRDKVWPQSYSRLDPDPAARFGTLANGMRYVVIRNATPTNQTALRMRVGLRLPGGDRRPAGPGPLHRAHGLRRLDPRAARRDGAHPGAARPGLRRRHQRLHRLDPDGVPARPAAQRRRHPRHRPDADARGGGRADPVADGRRRRARRGAVGGARPRHPRLPRPEEQAGLCAQGPDRRAPHADRPGRGAADRQGRTAARLLRRLVPARADDGDRRRRLRPGGDGGQDQGPVLRLAGAHARPAGPRPRHGGQARGSRRGCSSTRGSRPRSRSTGSSPSTPPPTAWPSAAATWSSRSPSRC